MPDGDLHDFFESPSAQLEADAECPGSNMALEGGPLQVPMVANRNRLAVVEAFYVSDNLGQDTTESVSPRARGRAQPRAISLTEYQFASHRKRSTFRLLRPHWASLRSVSQYQPPADTTAICQTCARARRPEGFNISAADTNHLELALTTLLVLFLLRSEFSFFSHNPCAPLFY
jgi:hypothetical protein